MDYNELIRRLDGLKSAVEVAKKLQASNFAPDFVRAAERLELHKNMMARKDLELGSALRMVESLAWPGSAIQKAALIAVNPVLGSVVSGAGKLVAEYLKNRDSPLIEYLVNESPGALDKLVPAEAEATISFAVSGEGRVVGADDLKDSQIVEHLRSGGRPDRLPAQLAARWKFVLNLLWCLLGVVAVESAVRQELCFYQPSIYPGMTSNQAGKAVRNAMCQAKLPPDVLNNFRLVKGDGVRLRTLPSTKAEVIGIDLPNNAFLEVVDSTDRSWLQVTVVMQDGVVGWISRKHTATLK